MKGRWGILLGCLLVLTPIGVRAHGSAVPGGARPAIWRNYELLVDLDGLSRTYSCDQLWYVFDGILLRLGAPIDSLKVLPYRCSRTGSGDMRSPRVQVSLRMPSVVHGAAVKWAQLTAVSRLIVIRPGKPKRLKPTDCRLLRQIRETLFESLPVRVIRSDLHCGRRGPFGVTVRVWVARPG